MGGTNGTATISNNIKWQIIVCISTVSNSKFSTPVVLTFKSKRSVRLLFYMLFYGYAMHARSPLTKPYKLYDKVIQLLFALFTSHCYC